MYCYSELSSTKQAFVIRIRTITWFSFEIPVLRNHYDKLAKFVCLNKIEINLKRHRCSRVIPFEPCQGEFLVLPNYLQV